MDLHTHTRHSKDGKISPEELARKAAKLGFDAIGVTDHGTVRGAIETERIAKRIAKDLIVIIGQEVKTKQGEVLVYGIRDDIEEEQDLIKTCQEVKDKKGFLIVPHPFDPMRRGTGKRIMEIMKHIDAVEGFNERTIINRFNDNAMAFVKENRIPAVVGSDAHFIDEFGKTYMLIESRKNKMDMLKAIRKGRVEFFMQGHGMMYGFKRGLKKIRTYF